jgi:deferrochelatase/peroxidase EfeB
MADPVIDYADVQGTLLRGYRVDYARHFILRIDDVAATQRFITDVVEGNYGLPRITTAQRAPGQHATHFLNLSFTAAGLSALGVSATDLQSFDAAFQRGATSATTANIVGDSGASAPANWVGGMSDGSQVHVVLSLWIDADPAELETLSAQLRTAFAGAMTELSAQDAQALPDNHVHFGYRDNIAQPTVIGAPPSKRPVPDDQPPVKTGEFLLGYGNETGGTYRVTPTQLSTNSSYAAFRLLEQDVAGFEAFLQEYSAKAGIDAETLAAKVCGRWRNGNPLVLAPDAPGTVLPRSQLNDFHYVDSDPTKDDTLGLKCPIGSHIRRNNPRDGAIVGTDSTHHRIVRRAMPYGPTYDPSKPDDIPRGLVGFFINASLTNQFEFLTGQWNLLSSFVKSATGPGGSNEGNAFFNISGQDVFLGVNDPSSSSFTLAYPGKNGSGNKTLTGFDRMIITRGSIYCFFPSISGLRYLAGTA